jgi:hypothetical protein
MHMDEADFPGKKQDYIKPMEGLLPLASGFVTKVLKK